ncbi:YopX family protein [Bacillus mycoides]|uniref:YopX family protein n=1 Tax=Bacillus mycoides TaxID=1405 RepID=UPI002E223135|nr:YopX family protein [Bacillus mycoides]
MREIKFRAWVGESWVYSECVSKDNDVWRILDHEDDNWRTCLEPQQFTGLKDKNGKEIYEGDIVDTVYDGELFTGIVVYDTSELGFKATNGKENYGSDFQYTTCCEEVEVIGNTYEDNNILGKIKS